jgi:hypothetical protein
MDGYVRWLQRQNYPIFEMAGTYWRPYQNALVPACPKPEPMQLSLQEARELLHRSNTLFLRYFTRTMNYPTAFWYTACREYDFNNLAPKVRAHIRRAHKSCLVQRIEPTWLAANGYPCYEAAFSRYKNSVPESRAKFEEMCQSEPGGPFDFWGVFVKDRLAGFAKSAVGPDYAATLVLKLDPDFLHLSIGPALQDTLLNNYVSEQGKPVYAGFRSVVHDTHTHDFLLQLGYNRVYCDLKVVYRPVVRTCVNLLYRYRSLLDRAPEFRLKPNIRGILNQEEMRRSVEADGRRVVNPGIFERIGRSIWGSRYGTTEK